MIDFTNAVVCIVGMGLMGSSAAQRINGHCKKLIGIDQQTETIQYAIHKHWIDAGYTSFDDLDENPDVIILSVPVRQILNYLNRELLKIGTPCVVIDFGSTKHEIIIAMKRLPENFQCFACHPMCGKEISGPFESDPLLFTGKPFLYHPLSKDESAKALVQNLIKVLGAELTPMDPEQHDRIMATISHVPHLMAAALSLVSSMDEENEAEELWKIAANGYHDMTRLAGSDVSMMIDIMATNPKQISMVLQKILDQLSAMKSLLDQGQTAEMQTLFEYAKQLKERANQCRK